MLEAPAGEADGVQPGHPRASGAQNDDAGAAAGTEGVPCWRYIWRFRDAHPMGGPAPARHTPTNSATYRTTRGHCPAQKVGLIWTFSTGCLISGLLGLHGLECWTSLRRRRASLTRDWARECFDYSARKARN